MHALAAVQDTAPSTMLLAPGGRATARFAQAVPFHARATVPTATHAALEGQDTPISAVARKTSSDVPSAPVTLGDAWIVHAEPCCVSASVRQAPGQSR